MKVGNFGTSEEATFMHGGENFFIGTALQPPTSCLAAFCLLPPALQPPASCLQSTSYLPFKALVKFWR
ncbi:MAG: hypothetical protein F6K47_39150 [Symploca sp. SIO2E6]|nr:hypothetical protein [Symploca sp. SIO2E6]